MATTNPITLPNGQKDLTRRNVLGGFTFAAAQMTWALNVSDDALPEATPLSHPVLALPFVRNTTLREQAAGAAPRSYWDVQPTGDYGPDCATGARYAALALDFMVSSRSPQIFQWAVFDMMTAGRAHSGIEVGFLSTFGQIATHAHAGAVFGKGGMV
jgi:hypothetical protein